MAATTKPKVKVADKAQPACKCGCGEHTKGGQFRPGHDARYHAAQRAAGKTPTYKLSAEVRAKRAQAIRDRRATTKAPEVASTLLTSGCLIRQDGPLIL